MPRPVRSPRRRSGTIVPALVLASVLALFASLVVFALEVMRPARPPAADRASVPATIEAAARSEVAAANANGAAPPTAVRADTGERTPVDRPILAKAVGPDSVERQPDALREVTGPGITAGPQASGLLIREPTAVVLPPQPPTPPEPYRLVVVRDAGIIDVRSHVVRIAHVEAPTASDTCVGPEGREWPCGLRARTALRRFIRRRAVACEPVGEAAQKPAPPSVRSPLVHGPETVPGVQQARLGTPAKERSRELVPSTCAVGDTDIGAWLVENGWAAPTPDAPPDFARLNETARTARVGLYQAAPR